MTTGTTRLRPSLIVIAICAVATGLILAPSSTAQTGQPTTSAPTSASASSPAPAPAPVDEPLFDLDFPGGTVAEYAAALHAAAPAVNVIVVREAADVPLPPIRLARVNASTAIALLDRQIHGGSPLLETSQTSGSRNRPPSGMPAFTIAVRRAGSPTDPQSPQVRSTEVASLDRVVKDGGVSAAMVLQAVEVAVRSTGLESSTSLAFHEPTNLLVVNGPDAAVRAAQGVLSALAPRRSTVELKAFEDLQAELGVREREAQLAFTEVETRANLLASALQQRERELADLQLRFADAVVEQRVADAERGQLRAQLQARTVENQSAADMARAESRAEIDRLRGRVADLEALLRRNNIKLD